MHRTLLLLGGLASVVLLVFGVSASVDAIDELSEGARIEETRTPVPGERTVELEERKYVVYYEMRSSSVDPGDFWMSSLELAILRNGDGPSLRFSDYDGEFEVTGGGRTAVAIHTVEVPSEGRYEIVATGDSDDGRRSVVLGRPTSGRVVRLVMGIAAFLAGLGLGVLVLVIAIMRRARRNTQVSPG